MENVTMQNPKDGQIINKEDTIINKDGDFGNENLPPAEESRSDSAEKQTVITGNNSLGEVAEENTSNKGQGPSGESI
jgi:hypothetical protein